MFHHFTTTTNTSFLAVLNAQRKKQQQQPQKNEWDSTYNHEPGLFDPTIKNARCVCMYVCMHVPIYACIPLTDALHLLHPLTYLFSLSMYSCRNVPMKMTSPIPNTRPSMHGRRGAHVGSPGSVADDSLMTSPKSSPTGAHKRIHIPHTIYHIPHTT